MIFTPLPIAGAWRIDPAPAMDHRGGFARQFCARTFAAHGLRTDLSQISFSINYRSGTLRGLHLQRPPQPEAKLVRVTRGAVFDVIVDLRSGSSTYGVWHAERLDQENRAQIYVPEGVAHGFQTLVDGTELLYCITTPYAAEFQDGVRWNDPVLGIAWPLAAAPILSERDARLPELAQFRAVAC